VQAQRQSPAPAGLFLASDFMGSARLFQMPPIPRTLDPIKSDASLADKTSLVSNSVNRAERLRSSLLLEAAKTS